MMRTMSGATKPLNIRRTRQLARHVAVTRWVVPSVLFLFVLSFETVEHLIAGRKILEFHFGFEIMVFGLVGPVLVGAILTWISHNLDRLALAYTENETLNAELEMRIEARTKDLADANEKLRQLDRLKSEFVSLVSHELRTPLTNIRGGLELGIEETAACSETASSTLKVVQSEVARLIRLVTQILDVSALEAGYLQLNCGPVALRPLIDEVSARCVLSSNSHHLVTQLPHQLAPVWADEERLADVLANLLDNAIKYSPAGSEIRVQATPENGHIHLSIHDQGNGIPTPKQTRLFEQFYRGDDANAVSGYGLGLYFCYKFIQAHGGRIWVESTGKPGEGTAVHFTVSIEDGAKHGLHLVD